LAFSCDAQKKAERRKLANAQTVRRSDRFFLPLLGANQRGPIEPMFDRFAMGICETSARLTSLDVIAKNRMLKAESRQMLLTININEYQ
jgi:hypothetical protein